MHSIPENLALIRLRIIVEGVVFEKDFEADVRLQYRFAWDRRNAYNQKVYGVATATGLYCMDYCNSHTCFDFQLSSDVCIILPCMFMAWELYSRQDEWQLNSNSTVVTIWSKQNTLRHGVVLYSSKNVHYFVIELRAVVLIICWPGNGPLPS